MDSLPEEFGRRFEGLQEGSREYIEECNRFAGEQEHLIAKTLFTAGTTWPGAFSWEDRRSVDYLLTRPEVDPERIGAVDFRAGAFIRSSWPAWTRG